MARLTVGLALLLAALLLPTATIASRMPGAAPGDAWLGLTIFRICLALEGVLIVVWSALPRDSFRCSGLPAAGPAEGQGDAQAQWRWVPLLLILAIGTPLRLIGLHRDLWVDEVGTVTAYLRLPPWRVLYTYYTPNQHLFYSLVGSVSVRVFGESEWSARLPAVLFGVGGLVALYYLGRAITSEREALLATLFLAVSYHHVWFSQDARGYTSMIFWSTLAMGLFVRGLLYNRPVIWAAYVASTVLAIASFQLAAFVFLGQLGAYFLILPGRPGGAIGHRALTRRVLVCAVLVVLLSVHVHSLVLPGILRFLGTAPQVTSYSGLLRMFGEGLRVGFLGVGFLGVFLLMAAGWLSYWRQSRLVALILALPPALGVPGTVLLRQGMVPRTFLFALPLALLIAVRGAIACGAWAAARLVLPGRWQRWAHAYLGVALVGLMLVLSAASLPRNYRYPKQDYRGALEFVDTHKGPVDKVSAAGMAAGVYRNYYRPTLEFPGTPDELAALRGPSRAVWVLYTFPGDMRLRFSALYDYIRANATIVATFPGTVGDGTIYVARIDGA